MPCDWTSNSVPHMVSPSSARRVSVIGAPSLAHPPIIDNLFELARYRDLLYTLTLHRIKVRYKQSLLGLAWAIVQPVSMMVIFTALFTLIARVPSDGAPYAIFAYVALLPWNAFSAAVSNATGGLVSHSQLVTKVYFPREILPITYVLAALFDFLIASSVLAALMLYYRVSLTSRVLYAVPIILVLTAFSLSIALFFSAAQVRFRDIGMAVPLLLQLWMFATPIIYPLSAVPSGLRSFYMLNPLVGVIEGFRQAVLYGNTPNLESLGLAGVVSIFLLITSYIWFKRRESTMADII